MAQTKNDDGWNASEKLVMTELKTLKAGVKDLTDAVVDLRVELARLKVKSGIWGLIGSSMAVAIGLAVMYLKGV